MKFVSRFLAFLLAVSLVVTALVYISSSTLFNQSRLQAAAHSAQLSPKISAAIPDILKANLGLSADETFILKTVLTPDRVQPYLDQIITKIVQPDPTPVQIDFSAFRQSIQNESLPLPPKLAELTAKPLILISSHQAERLVAAKHLLDLGKLFGPIAAVILAGLILLIARHSRFLVLGEASIMTAIGLGLIGLLVPSGPEILTSSIGTSIIAPLKEPIQAAFKIVFTAAQTEYFQWSMVAVGAGLLAFIIHGVTVLAAKFGKSKRHG